MRATIRFRRVCAAVALAGSLFGCAPTRPTPSAAEAETVFAAKTKPLVADPSCGSGRSASDPGVIVRDAQLLVNDRPVDGIVQTYLGAQGCLRVTAGDGADHVITGEVQALFFDRTGHFLKSAGSQLRKFHTVFNVSGDTPQALSNVRDSVVSISTGDYLGHPIDHYAVVPQVLFQVVVWPCNADGSACDTGLATTNWWLLDACVTDDQRSGQPIGACHATLPPSSTPPKRVSLGAHPPGIAHAAPSRTSAAPKKQKRPPSQPAT